MGIDPDDLKIAELYARVRDGTVREVVIATNPTTTGEATALHIAGGLREIAPDPQPSRGSRAGYRSERTSNMRTS